MRVISRGIVGLLALSAVVGMAASCSSDPSPPEQAPSASQSSSETPTPAASPMPTLPVAATEPTRAGAEAFAKYFFAVYNYSFWTADPEPLRAISDSGCVYCKSSIERVESIREKRTRVEGGRIRVATAAAAPGSVNDGLLVNLLISQEGGRTFSPTGEALGISDAVRNSRVDVAVRWASDKWSFLDAHILKDGES